MIASSHLNEHVFAADFDRKHFRALLLSAAGTVIEADAPAVPAADDVALLHDAFAQWKAQVRAKIFDGVNASFPSKQRNADAIGFNGVPEAIGGEVGNGRNAYPFVHVP